MTKEQDGRCIMCFDGLSTWFSQREPRNLVSPPPANSAGLTAPSTNSSDEGAACFSPTDFKTLCTILGLSEGDDDFLALSGFLASCPSLYTIEKALEGHGSTLSIDTRDRLLSLAKVTQKSSYPTHENATMFSPTKSSNNDEFDGSALVVLNVGGQKFETTRGTLCSDPDSMLAIMFSGRHRNPAQRKEDGSFVIDRDGAQFGHILNYLRVGNVVSLPLDEASRAQLAIEADYYGLAKLVRVLRMPQYMSTSDFLSEETLEIRKDESELRKAFMDGSAALLEPHQGLVSLFCPGNRLCQPPLAYAPVEDRSDILMDRLREETSPAGTPVTVQSMKEFRENFSFHHPFVLDRLASILSTEKVIIAGGSVLQALTVSPGIRTAEWWGESKNDVDIFLYCDTPDEANRVAERIFFALAVNGERWAVTWGHGVITMYKLDMKSLLDNGPYSLPDIDDETPILQKVQIVLRLYKSPTDILIGFDCDCCCAAYDGKSVLVTPRCIAALRSGVNTLNPLHAWPNKPSYELRLAKYAYRGFPVSVPGLGLLKEKNHVDCDRILRTNIEEPRGLARLLVVAADMEAPATTADGVFPSLPQVLPKLRPVVKRYGEVLGGYEHLGEEYVYIPDIYLPYLETGYAAPKILTSLLTSPYNLPLAEDCREGAWNQIIERPGRSTPEDVPKHLVDAWDNGARSREYLNARLEPSDVDNVYYSHALKQDD